MSNYTSATYLKHTWIACVKNDRKQKGLLLDSQFGFTALCTQPHASTEVLHLLLFCSEVWNLVVEVLQICSSLAKSFGCSSLCVLNLPWCFLQKSPARILTRIVVKSVDHFGETLNRYVEKISSWTWHASSFI